MALPDYVGLTTGAMGGFGKLMSEGMYEEEQRRLGPESERPASQFQKDIANAILRIQNDPNIQPEEISSIAKSIHAQHGTGGDQGPQGAGTGLGGMASYPMGPGEDRAMAPAGGLGAPMQQGPELGPMAQPFRPPDRNAYNGSSDAPMVRAQGEPVQPPRAVVRGMEPGMPGEQARPLTPKFNIDTQNMTRGDAQYLDKLAPDLFARARQREAENQFDVNQGRMNSQYAMMDSRTRDIAGGKLELGQNQLAQKAEQERNRMGVQMGQFDQTLKYKYAALAKQFNIALKRAESVAQGGARDEKIALAKVLMTHRGQATKDISSAHKEYTALQNNANMRIIMGDEAFEQMLAKAKQSVLDAVGNNSSIIEQADEFIPRLMQDKAPDTGVRSTAEKPPQTLKLQGKPANGTVTFRNGLKATYRAGNLVP